MVNKKIKILLVEDNPGDVRLIEEMIKEAGASQFTLSVEGTLDGALGCLRKESFEGVMLDLNLPDCQGLATLKRIQGNFSHVAVIVITGLDDEAIAIESQRRGAEDFLVKGKFDSFLLVRSLRYAIERKQAEEELKESEDRFRTIFNSTTDGILIADMENKKFFTGNKTICNMLYYTIEEMKNLGVMDIHPIEDLPFVVEQFGRLARKEITLAENIPMKRKDGSIFYADITSAPISLDGKTYLLGSFRDITERKKAEKTLKESEEKLRSIVENSSDQIFMIDNDFKFLSINKTGASLFRKSPQEMIGKPISEIFPENIVIQFSKNIKNVFDTGKSMFIEEKMVVQGREFYNSTSLNPVKDGGGRVIAVTGIVRDITERKNMENELHDSEERFRTIFEGANDGLLLADLEKKTFFTVNKTFCDMLGYSIDEMKNLGIMDIHPKEDLPFVVEQFEKQAREEISLAENIPVKRKDGSVFYADVNSSPMVLAGKTYLMGSFRDITERKKAEEALRESEERHRILFDSSQDAIMTLEPPSWSFTSGNPATIKMFKVKNAEELISYGPGDLSPKHQPDGRASAEASKEMIETAMRKGSCYFEWTHKRLDGTDFPATVLLTRMEIKGKQLLQATVRDITEQKQTEEEREKILLWQQDVNALQLSLLTPAPLEDKLKTITDSVVRFFDADFCRIWLTQPGDLCEQGCIHAEVHEGPHVCRYRDRCLRLRSSSGRYTHTDGNIHRRVPFGCYKIGLVASGEEHKFLTNDVQNDPRVHNNDWARELGLVSFAGYQLRVPGGEKLGVLALFAKHNITPAEDTILDGISNTVARVIQQSIADEKVNESTKKIEMQNVQLKKLDKIKSDFLNITSHELRTPMSAIKGYVQMVVKQKLGQITEEQQHALNVVLRNTDRLDSLIRDILDVSRLESGTMKFVPEKTDAGKMVKEAIETMQPIAELKNIKINTEIEPNIPELMVDHERIKQVIINIVNNAIKFSPDGSIINVRTKKDNDQILFEIQDYGRGIPKDKQEKIFEIFYQVDSGMDRKFGGAGLGLAISRGFVLSHGGSIWVESEPDKGSTFLFTLPITPVQDLEGKFRDVDIFKLKDTKRSIEKDLRNKTV